MTRARGLKPIRLDPQSFCLPKGMTRARGLKPPRPVLSLHGESAERHDARARVETITSSVVCTILAERHDARARVETITSSVVCTILAERHDARARVETLSPSARKSLMPKGMTRARGLKQTLVSSDSFQKSRKA